MTNPGYLRPLQFIFHLSDSHSIARRQKDTKMSDFCESLWSSGLGWHEATTYECRMLWLMVQWSLEFWHEGFIKECLSSVSSNVISCNAFVPLSKADSPLPCQGPKKVELETGAVLFRCELEGGELKGDSIPHPSHRKCICSRTRCSSVAGKLCKLRQSYPVSAL